ncbi:AAA family ATPase [Ferruginibacter sp.]
MNFKKLEIEGFRGIKKAEIDGLSMVNIFLGQNNCGKTSLLEAIFLLAGYNNANLALNIDLFRDLIHNEENDFSFLFYNLNYSSVLVLSAELTNKEQIKLEILPKDSSGQTKIIIADGNKVSDLTDSFSNSASDESNSRSVNQLEFKSTIKAFQQQKVEYRSTIVGIRAGENFQLTTKLDPKKRKDNFKALLQGSHLLHSKDLPKKLQRLIIDKRKDSLINDLKQIDPKITDITAFSDNMIYIDTGAKSLMPSNLMGDGFIKYLHTIININEVKGGAMLIDEVDNGLHFKALKNLWRILLRTASANKTQLFLTTHSKEALVYLKEVLEESEFITFQNDVKCFTISKLADSTLKSYRYDFEAFEYAIENDVEIRGEI